MTLERVTMKTWKKMKNSWDDLTSSLKDGWSYLTENKIDRYSFFVIVIFVLSILDAVFTLTWIKAGLAVEANPILGRLLEKGDFAFVSTKIFLTGAGCIFLLWARTKSRFAERAIIGAMILYVLVTLYHLIGAVHSIDASYLPDFVNDFLVWIS